MPSFVRVFYHSSGNRNEEKMVANHDSSNDSCSNSHTGSLFHRPEKHSYQLGTRQCLGLATRSQPLLDSLALSIAFSLSKGLHQLWTCTYALIISRPRIEWLCIGLVRRTLHQYATHLHCVPQARDIGIPALTLPIENQEGEFPQRKTSSGKDA